jgi:hypothetical protein
MNITIDFNWMTLPLPVTTTVRRVLNLDQAQRIIKMAKDEPFVVQLDTCDHRDESIDWTWSADYMRSMKWTIRKGWDHPTHSDAYAAIVFTAHHKGRCHTITVQKFGWNWSERVLNDKYWEETK